MTLGGAGLFMIFGVVYSYEAYFWTEELADVTAAVAAALESAPSVGAQNLVLGERL